MQNRIEPKRFVELMTLKQRNTQIHVHDTCHIDRKQAWDVHVSSLEPLD